MNRLQMLRSSVYLCTLYSYAYLLDELWTEFSAIFVHYTIATIQLNFVEAKGNIYIFNKDNVRAERNNFSPLYTLHTRRLNVTEHMVTYLYIPAGG